jgi:membrane-bound inhibitor of C-type lysozyme
MNEQTTEKAHFRVEDDGTLRYENGVACGHIAKDVDGYYYWWPTGRRGSWQGFALREIADLLDRMNAEWDAEVARDLSTSPGRAGD